MKIVAVNKKAFSDYEILEKIEAGIELKGSEVKAIREGRINLKDSFVKIIKSEAFLINAHISVLDNVNTFFKPDPRRSRKLLLHKKEIIRLATKSKEKGLTIIPLKVYFNERNLVKIEIALAKGKKAYNKKEEIKRKILDQEAKRALKGY